MARESSVTLRNKRGLEYFIPTNDPWLYKINKINSGKPYVNELACKKYFINDRIR